MRLFLNSTFDVVTFCLCGWSLLGVFLLLAFTHLGHECQDLLSPCNGMHVRTHKTSVCTMECMCAQTRPQFVQWNVCVHRQDLSLYSHQKEL